MYIGHSFFFTSNYEAYRNINPRRVEGTCRWVLDHRKFREWKVNNHTNLLWLSAGPGCGKSVLSRALIDDVLVRDTSATICYYFFKDSEEQNSAATAICGCGLQDKRLPRRNHIGDLWMDRINSNGWNLSSRMRTKIQLPMNLQLSPNFETHQVLSFLDSWTTSSRPFSTASFWVPDREMEPFEQRSSARVLASVASRNFLACVGLSPQLFILNTRRSSSEI